MVTLMCAVAALVAGITALVLAFRLRANCLSLSMELQQRFLQVDQRLVDLVSLGVAIDENRNDSALLHHQLVALQKKQDLQSTKGWALEALVAKHERELEITATETREISLSLSEWTHSITADLCALRASTVELRSHLNGAGSAILDLKSLVQDKPKSVELTVEDIELRKLVREELWFSDQRFREIVKEEVTAYERRCRQQAQQRVQLGPDRSGKPLPPQRKL